jgi:hypothetical protein
MTMTATADEITRVAAELRAFVRALESRKDIVVEHAKIGRKAIAEKLEQIRFARVPDELVDLYAEMDGIHVQWRFHDGPGFGCLRIPPITGATRFSDDDDHYMNFGDDREALLLDEITEEHGTWLVRPRVDDDDQPPQTPAIIFASANRGAEGVSAASSIAEYLRAAMDNGFGASWPRCFRPGGDASHAEQEQTIERFKAGADG